MFFLRSRRCLVAPLTLSLLLSLDCKDGPAEDELLTSKSPASTAAKASAHKPMPAQPRAQEPDEDRPRPVLLIGADGLDLEVVRQRIDRGHLPNLAALLERGAHGVLMSEREMRSPALWTTIATGRPRDIHGIYDFVTGSRLWPEDQRSDERHLVTSGMRKVPAIWNLASEAERKVVVVGWLNTWPAERINGVMVSPYVAIGRSKQITIKGGVYPDEPYQVEPAARWREIRDLITTPDQVPDDLVARFADEPRDALVHDLPVLDRYLDGLRWSLAHSLTMRAITLRLLETEEPDLAMVYFEGADSLGHRFWLFGQPLAEVQAQLREAGYDPERGRELKRLFGRVVRHYYDFLDEIIGELVAAFPADGRVLVVSDHGFGDRSGAYPINASVPFSGQHLLEGSLLATGPGIAAGKKIYGANQYDITPTLLDLLDIDTDVDFEGRSLVAVMGKGLKPEQQRHRRRLNGVRDRLQADPGADEPDQERFREQELERLRSLGYVQ